MTNMFFAGIPIEGSGARPLEADLYGADAPGSVNENISATGNLNVGVVINYDEHMQRYMSGGILNSDTGQSQAGLFARDNFLSAPASAVESIRNTLVNDNGALLQTAALPNPAVQGAPAGINNANTSTSTIPAGSGETSQQANSTTSSTASESNSHSSTVSQGGDTTIYNTYNYDNTVITNNDTTNNYNGGNITIGINDGGCGDAHGCGNIVAGLLHTVDTVLTGTTDIVNNIVHTTVTDASQLLGSLLSGVDATLTTLPSTLVATADSALGGITTVANGLLATTVNTADAALGQALPAVNDLTGDATGIVNNVLGQASSGALVSDLTNTLGNTVDDTLGHLTGGSGTGSLPSLLDANLSVLSATPAAMTGNALINVEGSLLSQSSLPQTNNSGLLNVDTSLLSTSPSASGAGDGLSISLNTGAVTQGALPSTEVNIPLPSVTQSVPVVQTTLAGVESAASTIGHDLAGTAALDPAVTLDALSQTASTVAAVDAGVLFTGTHATVGGSASSSSASSSELHVGSLLTTVLGHH